MEINKIKELHKIGFRGIINQYKLAKWLNSIPFYLSLIFTLLLMNFIFINEVDINKYLKNIIDISLSIYPNLLGFGLGGYAIMISFSNQIMLDSMFSLQNKKHTPTLYQKTSAIFAFVLILQAFSLSFAILVKLFYIDFELNFYSIFYINYFLSFINTFLLLISVLVLIDLVKNIYNIGQCFHQSLLLNYLKENSKIGEELQSDVKQITPKDRKFIYKLIIILLIIFLFFMIIYKNINFHSACILVNNLN